MSVRFPLRRLVRSPHPWLRDVRASLAIVAFLGLTGAHVTTAPTERSTAPTSVTIAPTSVSIAPTREAQIAPAPVPAGFDAARAWTHLQKQVAFGPRPSGSAALKQCRDYIIAELKKAGLDAREQAFVARTPAGDIPMIR